MKWNELKSNKLLVFMMNYEDSCNKPFILGESGGKAVIAAGITRNKASLGAHLYQLKLRGYVVNPFYGCWKLTQFGRAEVKKQLEKHGQQCMKSTLTYKKAHKDYVSLEKKLTMVEAERDGLRVEITMANHTNEYLDEQNNLLREENSKLKKKLKLIQQLLT